MAAHRRRPGGDSGDLVGKDAVEFGAEGAGVMAGVGEGSLVQPTKAATASVTTAIIRMRLICSLGYQSTPAWRAAAPVQHYIRSCSRAVSPS